MAMLYTIIVLPVLSFIPNSRKHFANPFHTRMFSGLSTENVDNFCSFPRFCMSLSCPG